MSDDGWILLTRISRGRCPNKLPRSGDAIGVSDVSLTAGLTWRLPEARNIIPLLMYILASSDICIGV